MSLKFVFVHICVCFFTFSTALKAQVNLVTIHPEIQKFIGDVSELDRAKYFSIHSPANSPLLQSFYEEYNVERSGRGFYGPGIEAKKINGASRGIP